MPSTPQGLQLQLQTTTQQAEVCAAGVCVWLKSWTPQVLLLLLGLWLQQAQGLQVQGASQLLL